MGKPTTSSGSVSVEDLSEQIDTLKNDLSALTQTLADLGIAKSNEARKAAGETATHLQNAGRDKFVEVQAQAEEFVNKQPATSLGIAAGLGFLIGMITARR